MADTPDMKGTAHSAKAANGGAENTASNGQATEVAQSLEAQLAEAQAKADSYLGQLQRERADFANFRKRTEKEREDAYQNAAVDTLRRLIPVIDDFERAISSLPADRQGDEAIKGFGLIHRKLVSLLDSAGMKQIDPTGQPFDPAFHEALGHDEGADAKSGHITTVLQKGYLYGERVIRPALVRVAG
jgi:molecular chaperone GrpE